MHVFAHLSLSVSDVQSEAYGKKATSLPPECCESQRDPLNEDVNLVATEQGVLFCSTNQISEIADGSYNLQIKIEIWIG